jgi:transposase
VTVTSRCHSWRRIWACPSRRCAPGAVKEEVDAGEREGLTTEQLEELRRLRRENRTLVMEREVLAKAVAFFARESEGR